MAKFVKKISRARKKKNAPRAEERRVKNVSTSPRANSILSL